MNCTATGALIAQARRDKGLTQRDLAQALHVSVQAVSKWERGMNFPDATLWEPLACLLDLTVSSLLTGGGDQPPQEPLVRDALALLLTQMGRKIRKWRGLFAAALAVLFILASAGGFCYVRDHTELLPQRHTVVSRRDDAELAALVAQNQGVHTAFFDMTLADGLDSVSARLELWTHEGLSGIWELGELSDLSRMDLSRRQLLIFSWTTDTGADPAAMAYGLTFAGNTFRSVLTDIPYLSGGYMAGVLGNRAVSIPQEGTVLLCLSLDAGLGGWRSPGYTGNVDALTPAMGEAFLLLRLFCS